MLVKGGGLDGILDPTTICFMCVGMKRKKTLFVVRQCVCL